jgi:hypothetical protein
MKSSFDPKKAECFKCGNIGHVKADCRTKSENFKKKVDFETKAYKYKKKYNDLKKSLEEKKSDKVLLAEHWDDENSSDDEDEDKCFMVLLENNNAPSKFAEDYDAAKRTNTLSFSGNRSSVFKVHNFLNYSSDEKQTMFKYLLKNFCGSLEEINCLEHENKDLKLENDRKQEVINSFLNIEEELRSQKIVYQKKIRDLYKEKEEFKEKAGNFEKICKSWCISSYKLNDCLNRQIPRQVKAVLGEDFILENQLDYDSDPNRFKSCILPNAFAYDVNGKRVVCNAFVRPKQVVEESTSSQTSCSESSFSDNNSIASESQLCIDTDSNSKVESKPSSSSNDEDCIFVNENFSEKSICTNESQIKPSLNNQSKRISKLTKVVHRLKSKLKEKSSSCNWTSDHKSKKNLKKLKTGWKQVNSWVRQVWVPKSQKSMSPNKREPILEWRVKIPLQEPTWKWVPKKN